jgi:arylsulfatase A-like enzyme
MALMLWLAPWTVARGDERPGGRPNILWLIAEDLGPELACYGTAEVFTPHLDRLAAQGMRFTRAYTTAPVCSPSRSAFMTGMYQTAIGAHQHRSHRDDGFELPPGVRVLTDWLRPAGYFTANVIELPESFGFRGTGKTDWNFYYAGHPFDSDRWADLKTHQPFFAQINFTETHRVGASTPTRFPPAPRRADPARVRVPAYYPDHPLVRQDWANYLDSVSSLDEKVGRVVRQLEIEGLAANTVVVFFGDNGQAHVRGKQWCYESGLRVPLIVRWPSGLPRPAGFKAGQASAQLVDMIDLSATTLAWAGLRKPSAMQGRVLFGPHAQAPRRYAFGARDRCDETPFRFRTVRDARYRYIRNFTPDRPFLSANQYKESSYPVWNLVKQLGAAGELSGPPAALAAPTMPAEELFDLQSDPDEIRNLAGSERPEHRRALRRLRRALEGWIRQTRDGGAEPESDALVRQQGVTRPEATHPNFGYAWSSARGIHGPALPKPAPDSGPGRGGSPN